MKETKGGTGGKMDQNMKTNSSTTAERVTWMSRTSDIVGSHLKTDIESYLSLIRRKIQEKCATTQDLIYQIRRNKIGEGGHVTPNEFRYTLIKFGVILSQPLVDRIFTVFDSDRSGTMDFDEFAMWIMNSEFKPVTKNRRAPSGLLEPIIPHNDLRLQLIDCMNEHKQVFNLMKKKVSFLELISDVNRKNMKLSEYDVRKLFLIFDENETGYLDSSVMMNWAKTGTIVFPDTTAEDQETRKKNMSVKEAIFKICGLNHKQLQKAFDHIPVNKGIKISFEEFHRCLIAAGLGLISFDAKNLFDVVCHLSGDSSSTKCQVDVLRKHLVIRELNPTATVSLKKDEPAYLPFSRADRRIRDEMRKSFKVVKEEIEANDKDGTGFIDIKILHNIISKLCTQVAVQDIRRIVETLQTEDFGSKVNWRQFLKIYSPRKAMHQFVSSTTKLEIEDADRRLTIRPQVSPINTMQSNGDSPTLSRKKKLTLADTTSILTQLKIIWKPVLRACHQADNDKTGLISRSAFKSIVILRDPDNKINQASLEKLTSEYTLSNGHFDYMTCFRNILSGEQIAAFTNQRVKDSVLLHTTKTKMTQSSSDAAMPAKGASKNINLEEEKAFLSKYPLDALKVCNRAGPMITPNFRTIRSELKKVQVRGHSGVTLCVNFVAILDAFQATIHSNDQIVLFRAFKYPGIPGCIKFDDFLKVSVLVKHLQLPRE